MLAGIFYLLFSFAAATTPNCCFVHPSYAGICVVEPAPDESCSSILDYLNSPGTVGKTYCGGTPIRGGWRQVRCQ